MDIFIGYASADRRFGKALKQVLSTTEDHVWHNEELTENGASTLETSNAFILVLSAKALLSDELRSQALHYATIHNFHPDHRLIAVLLDPIPERDLWLFIRHAQVIERAGRSGAGGDSDAALIAQVKRALLSDEQHPASPIVVDAYDITLERPAVTGVALAHDSKNSWRRIAAGAGAALALLILTAVVSAQIVPGGQHHTALRSPHAATSRSGTPGATANPTKPNATLIVQQMTPTPLPTATATSQPTPAGPLAPVPDLNFTNGFAGANGLQLNSSALIADARLRLTTNDAGETSSVFARAPVPVTTFTTTFTFQDTNASANGFTFTLQNATPSALGSSGAGLGYSGIAQSVAIKFNLWNASADSAVNTTGLYTNGALPNQPEISVARNGIDFHDGHVFQVTLQYNDTFLVENIRDNNTGAFFRAFYTVDIPDIVGGRNAFAGFTGSTGGNGTLTATQDILTWSYAGN